jgi:3-isopropylmalate/(R)-2-methylmalate dehydratase small subunit
VGLPLLECPGISDGVEDGDILSADIETGVVVNETKGARFRAKPVAPFLMEMLQAGGLIEMAPRLADKG